MTVNLSPQTEAKLFDFAKQEGIEPAALIERLVSAYQPHPTNAAPFTHQPKYTVDNDPLMARLEALIASAPTDPDTIREAEEDLNDLMRNMNANRAATGGRLPFPDAQ